MAIGELCSRDVVFVALNESCALAAQLMREQHVGSLVVVREEGARRVPVVDAAGALVGVLAADDLIELFGAELAGLAEMFGKGPSREREARRAAL